jgi:hypothetical protein
MTEYIEIEDLSEIHRLNMDLSEKLKRALPHVETRTIGTPTGSFKTTVRFLSDTGTSVLYWQERSSKKKPTGRNLFGHGAPGTDIKLNIDMQFNVPLAGFSRRLGAAFLLHVPSKSIVLAHRGIATVGHGRVQKAEIFSKMYATVREAETSDGTSMFLLIGKLESPTLVGDIDGFSAELREAVKTIKANSEKATSQGHKSSQSGSPSLFGKLREYFDEFSGKQWIKGRRNTVADCYHGNVVRAVKDEFKGATETLKSQAIDLTVILGERVYLFEVKTSPETQSVYTAIGQLAAHAPTVADYAPGKTLVKVMVVPDLPNQRLCSLLKDRLGIRILTFTRSPQGEIAFDDLEKLKL